MAENGIDPTAECSQKAAEWGLPVDEARATIASAKRGAEEARAEIIAWGSQAPEDATEAAQEGPEAPQDAADATEDVSWPTDAAPVPQQAPVDAVWPDSDELTVTLFKGSHNAQGELKTFPDFATFRTWLHAENSKRYPVGSDYDRAKKALPGISSNAFVNGYRKKANCTPSRLVMLDYDENMTKEAVFSVLRVLQGAGLQAFALPSASSLIKPEKEWACHVWVQMPRAITPPEWPKIWGFLRDITADYAAVDEATKDMSRFSYMGLLEAPAAPQEAN